ncbi:glycosyltransferase [Cohnella cholangitidis]|uniref:Glycosyltransferase family 4 protein n=1 Tax=Cohnella cholangitidis TaxID=2598458 RepID=A0A7G5BXN4_9BACL|nr:glycosyltransferase [Cohnella cholangitidis]QMV41718.1 glycosyltransferase family 4 protein [Cohnella cholangitidis]
MKNLITYILPVSSQPRFHKRIQSFEDQNHSSLIFSFERNYFEGKKKDIEYTSLGYVAHGNYLSRIKKMYIALRILARNKDKISESLCLYSFGLDNAVMALIVRYLIIRKRIKVVCEIGDIRSKMVGNSLFSKCLRKLERLVLRKVDCIVVTAPAYRDEYLIKLQKLPMEKIEVIENKLYPPIPDVQLKQNMDGRPLVIGLFGLLRCQRSWNIISRLAEHNRQNIQIYIRGFLLNISDFQEKLNQYPNMRFEGEYVSPDDLADMYAKVDICWIANMSNNDINGNWALPNRYYESIYYHTPIIAHAKSGVAPRIEQNKCGWTVDFDDEESAIRQIESLTRDEVLEKMNNCKNVDQKDLVGTRDHDIFIRHIIGTI